MRKFQVIHELTEDQIEEADINEAYFTPGDGYPVCIGYCIGPDDGISTLYRTPDEAYGIYKMNNA